LKQKQVEALQKRKKDSSSLRFIIKSKRVAIS